MAFQSIWYQTEISDELVNIILNDISSYETDMDVSELSGNIVHEKKRKSHNAWIPTSHWVGGMLWHYIQRANRENFFYDIDCIEGETLQYTQYSTDEYYGWHQDSGLSDWFMREKPVAGGTSHFNDDVLQSSEKLRKLSVILQLSDENNYTGGQLQLLDERGQSYFAPKTKGTIIIFDSRTRHRVRPIKSGERRSLVAWVVGPRWK
jgi:predicted 2-oxoglutarate/Fe(II)-dependent dioxygenase YbiX